MRALKTNANTKVNNANIIRGFNIAHTTPNAEPRKRSERFVFHMLYKKRASPKSKPRIVFKSLPLSL